MSVASPTFPTAPTMSFHHRQLPAIPKRQPTKRSFGFQQMPVSILQRIAVQLKNRKDLLNFTLTCKRTAAVTNVGSIRQPGSNVAVTLCAWYERRTEPAFLVKAVREHHRRSVDVQSLIIVTMLRLGMIRHVEAKNDALSFVCRCGYVNCAQALLRDPEVDPAAHHNRALRTAAASGHARLVEILICDPRVDPASGSGRPAVTSTGMRTNTGMTAAAADSNFAIQRASEKGHAEVVEILLRHPFVDPAANYNYAIRAASTYGHATVVDLLLRHPRTNPTAPNHSNLAIQHACENGHAAVVRILLCDRRVNPSVEGNYSLREACSNGHTAVVQALINDARLDLSSTRDHHIIANFCLQDAVGNGHLEIVDLLLKDHRFDPTFNTNFAIRWASERGQAGVVQRLLTDPRVEPTANGNEALRWASEAGRSDVLRLLSSDPRVIHNHTMTVR